MARYDSDRDLTGESLDDNEVYGECQCPVCDTSDIEYEDTELDVADTVYVDYKCRKCGSVFSIRYEFTGAYVMTDGRYDHEEE